MREGDIDNGPHALRRVVANANACTAFASGHSLWSELAAEQARSYCWPSSRKVIIEGRRILEVRRTASESARLRSNDGIHPQSDLVRQSDATRTSYAAAKVLATASAKAAADAWYRYRSHHGRSRGRPPERGPLGPLFDEGGREASKMRETSPPVDSLIRSDVTHFLILGA